MFRYVLKRIFLAFITAIIILSVTFILMKMLPFQMPAGTPSENYAYFNHQVFLGYVKKFEIEQTGIGKFLWSHKEGAGGGGNRTFYFYQVPIMEEFFTWTKNIVLRWDWGVSTYLKPNASAMGIIIQKLPYSIQLNVLSLIISVPVGIALGIIAALKKNKPTDHIISTFVMVFISIPSFVLITFVMLFLCYNNQILPSNWPASTATLGRKISAFIIPTFCLSFGSICAYCRLTRAELCEVMSSEYLLLARTKGLTKRQAIIRHALRNAMVPILPMIIAQFISSFFGGSMILENLYGIPGIGRLFIEALNRKDYNVLFVDMAVFTTIGLLAGVLIDISYGFIDPRIRMGAKK